jgi:hypothetical protein
MAEGYRPFENVAILAIVGDGWIGARNIKVIAQLGEK